MPPGNGSRPCSGPPSSLERAQRRQESRDAASWKLLDLDVAIKHWPALGLQADIAFRRRGALCLIHDHTVEPDGDLAILGRDLIFLPIAESRALFDDNASF